MAAEMLTENDFEPLVSWAMVRVPLEIVPAYMLTLEDELYTVWPLITQVTGPVLYHFTLPPTADNVHLMVDVLFATDCVAVQASLIYLPSYLLVLTDPLKAIYLTCLYEYWM
jgi:hypothetical protein